MSEGCALLFLDLRVVGAYPDQMHPVEASWSVLDPVTGKHTPVSTIPLRSPGGWEYIPGGVPSTPTGAISVEDLDQVIVDNLNVTLRSWECVLLAGESPETVEMPVIMSSMPRLNHRLRRKTVDVGSLHTVMVMSGCDLPSHLHRSGDVTTAERVQQEMKMYRFFVQTMSGVLA